MQYPPNPYGPGPKPLPHQRFTAWYGRMWRKSKPVTLIVTIIVLVLSCGLCSGAMANADRNLRTTLATDTPTAQTTPQLSLADRAKTDTTLFKLSPTPTPTQTPFHVDVTNQAIKSISGKYRYFFDVRNHDTRPFNGSVKIELYNDKQAGAIRSETFDTTSAIQPNLGTSVYFDIYTGPPLTDGAYGITHFKFTVTINGQTVNSGQGPIPNQITD